MFFLSTAATTKGRFRPLKKFGKFGIFTKLSKLSNFPRSTMWKWTSTSRSVLVHFHIVESGKLESLENTPLLLQPYGIVLTCVFCYSCSFLFVVFCVFVFFFCPHWSLVDVPLIFFCPADHVPDWQPPVLLGMVEARSVNVKKTTTTTVHSTLLVGYSKGKQG